MIMGGHHCVRVCLQPSTNTHNLLNCTFVQLFLSFLSLSLSVCLKIYQSILTVLLIYLHFMSLLIQCFIGSTFVTQSAIFFPLRYHIVTLGSVCKCLCNVFVCVSVRLCNLHRHHDEYVMCERACKHMLRGCLHVKWTKIIQGYKDLPSVHLCVQVYHKYRFIKIF